MYVLLTVLCLSWAIADGCEWCYTGCALTPSHWPEIKGGHCGGKRQSPINIVRSHVKKGEHLGNFTFVHFESQDVFDNIVNTGETVKVNLKDGSVELRGGGLNGNYTVKQLHFHWGENDLHPGSEHLIDGKRYHMEMHIVSLKKGYTTEQALADPEGLAVLGFLIESNKTMSKSEPWVNLTSHIKSSTESVSLTDAISINDLIGKVDLTRFYRYEGSLTTPMCDEAVIWTVFEEPIHVHADLLQLFPNITKVTNVYRPEQQLENRKVYASPAVQVPSAHKWCYDKHECDHYPEQWYTLADTSCGKEKQSPINISSKKAIFNKQLNPFKLSNFDDKNAIKSVINTGHSVKYVLREDRVEVSGGGLGHVYSALQFHFHWADNSSDPRGSEHLLDSKRSPMEMHIVTKRKDLPLDQALKTGNGLAVLGFFIEVSNETKSSNAVETPIHEESNQTTNTEAWKLLSGYLSDIQKIGTEAKFTSEVSLEDLLGDVEHMPYYRYNGSLTTPSCNEAVVWTMFKTTIKVEQTVAQQFPAKMKYYNVYRPAQELHGRIIYTSAAAASNLSTLLLLLTCAFTCAHVLSE